MSGVERMNEILNQEAEANQTELNKLRGLLPENKRLTEELKEQTDIVKAMADYNNVELGQKVVEQRNEIEELNRKLKKLRNKLQESRMENRDLRHNRLTQCLGEHKLYQWNQCGDDTREKKYLFAQMCDILTGKGILYKADDYKKPNTNRVVRHDKMNMFNYWIIRNWQKYYTKKQHKY